MRRDATSCDVNTHVQHVVNSVEAEMPKIIKETLQRKKHIINEKINQVTKHVEIPQLQTAKKIAETPQTQTIQGTQTSESLGTAPVCQVAQAGHVEVKSRTRSRDCDTGRTARTHEDMKEHSRSADRPKAQVSTSIVQRLKSKFEAKQKGSQVPTVQRVQKTVEVPRVQYIDKVVDIPVEAARQDTQHENKKRKTFFVNIASGDEAEDGTENESAMTRCLVQGEESMLMDETDA